MIDAPGVYDLPMEVYHSQCCAGPSVSSSGLRTIYHKSPAEFWAFSDLNDGRFEKAESPALSFGRAAHALVLGDEVFAEHYAIIPDTAPPRPTKAQQAARARGNISASAKERFDFWDHIDPSLTMVTEQDLEHIGGMAAALRRHPIIPPLLEGQVEKSLIWKDEATGIWLKSRLDILSATGDLADFKTTVQDTPEGLFRDIRKHGYDMQMGLATMGLEAVMGEPFDADAYEGQRSAILIFVAKAPPYHVMPVELTFDALHWGRIKCRKAIDTMAECLRSGEWPGPVPEIATYTADFEKTRLLDMQDAGQLPLFA